MSVELILFYIFAAIRVRFRTLRHHAEERCAQCGFLAATLLSVAGIFLTLHAEFLAGVQVIVYVGGILVLFVFVIMLISVERSHHRAAVQPAVDDCADRGSAALIAEFGIRALSRKRLVCTAACGCDGARPTVTGNSQLVGKALLRQLSACRSKSRPSLLLVAIVGAVVLAKRKTQAE